MLGAWSDFPSFLSLADHMPDEGPTFYNHVIKHLNDEHRERRPAITNLTVLGN